MIAVALKGLAARKVRALLTALAVVIGVSMISGTFILTDTMQKSFNGLFTDASAGTDAVVRGKEVVKNSTSGSGITIPASTLDKVRELPEVKAASGTVSPAEANVADIIGKNGKAVARESVGGSYDAAHPAFSPYRFKTGKPPHGAGEVAIDAGTAKKHHYEVGDTVVVSTLGKRHEYRVSGTVSFGSVDSLGFASIAAWDVPTAQKLLNRDGRYDQLSVAAKAGTSPAELVKAIKPLLGTGLEVKDSQKQAKEDAKELNDGMAMIRNVLLGFGAIALLVGAFVIFNTLSITVAQRTREFATLRTLGASRKQVMRSVRLEGVVIGFGASLIGLVLGIGIAKGMVALFSAMGVELPEASMVIATHTITISLLVGTGVTLLASILPARRATRVPPIAAVREGSVLPKSRWAAHSTKSGVSVTGAALGALGVAMFANGVSGGLIALLAVVGVLGLFLGIALLAPRLVKPIARVVGLPAKHAGGVAGELAGANSVRNPGRTASTAAALMIGLTLVTVVATLGAGITAGTKDAITKQVKSDYVIDGQEDLPFRASEGDELAGITGVTGASHVRADDAIVQGKQTTINGIDPTTIARYYAFNWSTGSDRTLDRLGDGDAVVTKTYAEDKHVKVGSELSVKSPSGHTQTVVVRGMYDPPEASPMLADVLITQKAFDSAYSQPKNGLTLLDGKDSAAAAIKAAAKRHGDLKYHTGPGYADDKTNDLAVVLGMLYVLLGFSVIVSLFGMVNTMVLSVFERTREIGMLRTIGMTRRQARRMIRHESIITALIGAALGLGLGLFLSAMVSAAVDMEGLPFVIPTMTLVAFTVLAIVAGIGAAIMPARRASRLNVLEALQYE
jgi:putative ABC transport system permease protein